MLDDKPTYGKKVTQEENAEEDSIMVDVTVSAISSNSHGPASSLDVSISEAARALNSVLLGYLTWMAMLQNCRLSWGK